MRLLKFLFYFKFKMKLKSITNLIFPSKDDEKKQVDAKIVDDTSNTDSNNVSKDHFLYFK